jgi:iron only hydrogenase large subunit-like protein
MVIKAAGIDFMNLPDSGPKSQFDPFMGLSTGASSIFGVTGGVMEAALRTVVELASCTECANGECSTDVLTHTTKIPSTKLIFEEVRGFEGLREATIKIPANPKGPLLNVAPITLRVAIVNGLGNAKKLLKSAPEKYHFVEVMACRGGCIGGGGQPRSKDKSILEKRRDAIYGVGERCELRRSHENPVVKEMYSRWLDKPGSPQAESLLHTNYVAGGPKKYNVTLGQNLQDIEHDMQVEEKDDKK